MLMKQVRVYDWQILSKKRKFKFGILYVWSHKLILANYYSYRSLKCSDSEFYYTWTNEQNI